MAQRFYSDPANFGVGYPVIGYTSIQFSQADPVYIDTNGCLNLCSGSTKILGYSLDDVTMSATNTTVELVCPKYVYAEGMLMVYPIAASAAAAQTDLGHYTVFSGVTSGTFTLTNSFSTTVGQVLVVGLNPNNGGSTTVGTTAELSECVVRASFKQGDTYAPA